MGRIETPQDVERYVGRIVHNVPVKSFVSTAFPNESGEALANALTELSLSKDVSIKAGGRSLRQQIGCQTIDVSAHIRCDTQSLDWHTAFRLRGLLPCLENYPIGATRPDLDFFFEGTTNQNVINVIDKQGLDVKIREATGNVQIIEVKGKDGGATFVHNKDSWQTEPELWPPYGFQSPITIGNNGSPNISINISRARVFATALEIACINDYPSKSPKRMAAAGKAVLWSTAELDPNGDRLRLPSRETQDGIIQTVCVIPDILDDINEGKLDPNSYKSSLRDFAVALRLILINPEAFDNVFYRRISANFQMSCNLNGNSM